MTGASPKSACPRPLAHKIGVAHVHNMKREFMQPLLCAIHMQVPAEHWLVGGILCCASGRPQRAQRPYGVCVCVYVCVCVRVCVSVGVV